MRKNLRWGGVQRISLSLLGLQGLAAAVTLPFWPRIGFHPFAVQHWWIVILVFLVPWLYLVTFPSRSAFDRRLAELALAMTLLLVGNVIAAPAQYVVVSFGRPPIDLAAWDRLLGFDVPRLTHWIAQSPRFVEWLAFGYFQVNVQMLALPALLGLLLKDTKAMWELVWHATVCVFLCVLVFAIWPAGAPAAYYNHDLIADLLPRLGAGLPIPRLSFGSLQGLISFPSLHVLWAWLFTWSVRRHRWLLAILLPINLLMGAATVCLGLHFGVDLLGSAVVAVVSVASYWLVSAPARLRLFGRVIPAPSRLVPVGGLYDGSIHAPKPGTAGAPAEHAV